MTENRTYIRYGGAVGMFDQEVNPEAAETVGALVNALSDTYERGWQPADIVHLARRSKDRSDVDAAAAVILHEAQASRAEDRAPSDWVHQIRTIAEQHPQAARLAGRVPSDGTGSRALAAGLMFEDPYLPIHQLADLSLTWTNLPGWTVLTPPPSTWPQVRLSSAEEASVNTSADAKILQRIRGLLAKAESTGYPEEAEIFTAKAQELMTRYAIDAALLHARSGTHGTAVRSMRIHLDNPYVKEKVNLLTEIGESNRVRTVWFSDLAIATAVGAPLDLRQVDLLFTSLLVQATRAMQFADARSRNGSQTTSFRKGFLAGFAGRIGRRLREADTEATVAAADEASIPITDLLPLLATRSEAVDAEFDRLFPRTRKVRRRPVDAEGWYAGEAAADDASLSPG